MRFRVTGQDGAAVEVEAVDWMMAMSGAIKQLGLEVSGWICDNRPNGDTQVTDSGSGRTWVVRPLRDAAPAPKPLVAPTKGAPPPVPAFLGGTARPRTLTPKPAPPRSAAAASTPRAPAPPPKLPDKAPIPHALPPRRAPDAAPAQIGGTDQAAQKGFSERAREMSGRSPSPEAPNMKWAHRGQVPPPMSGRRPTDEPAPQAPTDQAPADLAERLFDVSMDISGAADKNAACSLALEIALDLVPCEAGSVLRGTINDSELTFVAVSGPVGDKLLGRKVPFGRGLVGVAFDLGITVQVNDVTRDNRHNKAIDKETGFVTRSILCVPVRTSDGFYGCMQLLNPPGRFQGWHLEVAETVARTLAQTLHRH